MTAEKKEARHTCGTPWTISKGPGRVVGAIARSITGVHVPLPDDFEFEYCPKCNVRNMTSELEQRFLAVEAAASRPAPSTGEARSDEATGASDFGWWARFEDEGGSFGWLTSSFRDPKVHFVYTEDPDNAYRFATAAEAQKAIDDCRLFPGGAWHVVEHKDEGMGDDRNADHMQAEIERSERAVAAGPRAETARSGPTSTDTSVDVRCGDCSILMRAIPDESVDLVLTDPPYEIEDMREHFAQMLRVLKPSGSIYVFGDKDMVADKWFSQMQLEEKTLLVWHYKNSPKPKGRWRMSMQAVIYGYKDPQLSVFHEDEARTEYLPSTKKLHGRMRPSSGRMPENAPYDMSKGALPRDVIEHPALLGHLSRERVGHRDQKPLGLIEKLIRTSSNIGHLVLDPFSGSGTTLVAAKRTGRSAIGFERDRSWVEVTETRLSGSEAHS